jgi:hypothetical protein
MKKILALLLPLFLVGCYVEGPQEPNVGELSLSTYYVELSANATTETVGVTTPYVWYAQTSDSWISIEQASDATLRFNVSQNYESQPRQGSIIVYTDDYNLSAELIVYQLPSIPDSVPAEGLYLHISKRNVYDDGIDKVIFTVYFNGTELKEGYEIYLGEENFNGEKDANGRMIFTSTKQGVYDFWAGYGTLFTSVTYVYVIDTPPAIPEAPVDNNPSKTNFKRRVLLTQFTGTGCGYCPNMVNALYQVTSVKSLNDKIVLTAAHLYNANDPAYLIDAKTLDNSMGVSGYPSLHADLNKSASAQPSYANVTKLINDSYGRIEAKGGIAVNSKYYEKEGYIVLNAIVKAKETTGFRIGAWLLEDNISGVQANYGTTPLEGVNLDEHNNCIRLADSAYSNMDFTGYALGTIEAGKTKSQSFSFKLDKNWKAENLRVVVFISTKEDDGNWYVNNVVKCPKDGSVDFEYAE